MLQANSDKDPCHSNESGVHLITNIREQEIEQQSNFQQAPETKVVEIEIPLENNCSKIILKSDLNEKTRGVLKKRFQAYYVDNWTIPMKHKVTAEAYLKNLGIDFTLEDTYERYHSLSQNEQRIERLNQATVSVAKKGLCQLEILRDALEDYNFLYKTKLKVKDFDEKSAQEIREQYVSLENLKQVEHIDIIYNLHEKFNQKRIEERDLHKKIKILIGADNPKNPWNGIEIPSGYILNNSGVWKENISSIKKINDECEGEQEKKTIKICDSVWVAARSRDYGGGNSGLILCWIDMDGIEREACIERRKLHTAGNQIAEELAYNNLSIVPGKEKELLKYLAAFTTNKTYRAVKTLGWLENPSGDLLYVSEKNTFKRENEVGEFSQEEIIFQPETISSGASPLDSKGTLEQWKNNIGIPCRGNAIPIFLQSIALSGTIVKYADTGSRGVHLSGFTSRGKTTAAQTAASVIGCAADPSYAPKLSIIKRWLATANALESLASQSTDSILVLDEIGQCPSSDLDKVIYNLFGGRGKERLSQQSQHKATRDWCTVVISTGEKTLQERLQETNSKTPAGLFVRFIDLHAEEVFTNYHSEDSKIFIDKLKRDCGLFYGTPAATFIQKVIEKNKNYQELRENISKGCLELEVKISNGVSLSQEHSRVLTLFCFATLTGLWAIEWEIFPYTKEEILESAKSLFANWYKNNQKQTEDVRCICAIQDYFLKKRESAFRPRYLKDNDNRRFGDVFGYTTEEGKFFLTKEGLAQALGGLPKKKALDALFAKGYLLREESSTRNESKKTIDGIDGAPRVFVISEKICEFDGEMF